MSKYINFVEIGTAAIVGGVVGYCIPFCLAKYMTPSTSQSEIMSREASAFMVRLPTRDWCTDELFEKRYAYFKARDAYYTCLNNDDAHCQDAYKEWQKSVKECEI